MPVGAACPGAMRAQTVSSAANSRDQLQARLQLQLQKGPHTMATQPPDADRPRRSLSRLLPQQLPLCSAAAVGPGPGRQSRSSRPAPPRPPPPPRRRAAEAPGAAPRSLGRGRGNAAPAARVPASKPASDRDRRYHAAAAPKTGPESSASLRRYHRALRDAPGSGGGEYRGSHAVTAAIQQPKLSPHAQWISAAAVAASATTASSPRHRPRASCSPAMPTPQRCIPRPAPQAHLDQRPHSAGAARTFATPSRPVRSDAARRLPGAAWDSQRAAPHGPAMPEWMPVACSSAGAAVERLDAMSLSDDAVLGSSLSSSGAFHPRVASALAAVPAAGPAACTSVATPPPSAAAGARRDCSAESSQQALPLLGQAEPALEHPSPLLAASSGLPPSTPAGRAAERTREGAWISSCPQVCHGRTRLSLSMRSYAGSCFCA